MSTSTNGELSRSAEITGLKKAVLAGVTCLLVFTGGASAGNGRDASGIKAAKKKPVATQQQTPRVYRGAEVLGVFPATRVSVDMSKVAPAKRWRPGDAIKEIPKRSKVRPGKQDPAAQAAARAKTAGADPLLSAQHQAAARQTSRTFDTTILNFDGQGFTGANPPDTVGDVGVDYYIQMVNGGGTSVTIYNKADGSQEMSFQLESLAPAGAGVCANGLGDPVVLYDRLAQRWFLSEFSSSGNAICMYVSQTGDPTSGDWFFYEIIATSFPDYPKYAVWPDAYYISSNESSPTAYAIDRTAMLNGDAATFVKFVAPDLSGFGFQALQAANVLGLQEPPAGSPGIFMRHNDDEAHNPGSNNPTQDFLEIFEFDVDFATPGNSTFTGPISIPISEIDSELCGFFAFECFPQPGTTTGLDPLREVIMFPLIYRNFGSHETLVGNLVTDVDGNDQGGVRWFELRKTGAGDWSLFQEGTQAPDADSRFMASNAMDGAGNIAMAYNVTSTTTSPSLRYAGRLAGDPLGTLPQGEHSIVEGSASNSSNRYGDYSAMGLDPTDDCTFWFTGMYNVASTWSTRIASIRFDACGEPGFSLSVNPSNPQVCAPPGDVEPITLNVGSVADFAGDVTLSLGLPTGIAGVFSNNPVAAGGSTDIDLSVGAGAAPGNNIVTVFGTAQDADDRQTSITVGVTTDVPSVATPLAPADGATDTSLSPALSWTDTGAEEYLVEVATDDGFTDIVDSAQVSGTSYQPSGLDIQTTYFWRVRGSNICGDGNSSATSSFTTGLLLCSSTPLSMPDGSSTGVTQDFVITTPGTIASLDVSLRVTHTWVGDLIFSLTNLDTGTTVTLMDRPGDVLDPPFGCSDNDIDATFTDDGNYAIEDACAGSPGPEGVAGTPIPEQSLSAFDGESITGTWRLFASDNAGIDTGQVDEWCLLPTFAGGADSDGDGIPDASDNCIDEANPDQTDTNGDGIGNRCDADFDNDCTVGLSDLSIFRSSFLLGSGNPDWIEDTDLDNDQTTNLSDLAILRSKFLRPPGPAANPNSLSGCTDE